VGRRPASLPCRSSSCWRRCQRAQQLAPRARAPSRVVLAKRIALDGGGIHSQEWSAGTGYSASSVVMLVCSPSRACQTSLARAPTSTSALVQLPWPRWIATQTSQSYARHRHPHQQQQQQQALPPPPLVQSPRPCFPSLRPPRFQLAFRSSQQPLQYRKADPSRSVRAGSINSRQPAAHAQRVADESLANFVSSPCACSRVPGIGCVPREGHPRYSELEEERPLQFAAAASTSAGGASLLVVEQVRGFLTLCWWSLVVASNTCERRAERR
jgi:hypothetical protein